MAIRGFNPSAVQRQHIKPKTLLFGTDKPGIELRLERFEEILFDEGERPVSFANASSALGYMASGDMFSDHICVIIHDVSDMLKSDTAAKQTLASMTRAMATYSEDSTIVLGAVASDSQALRKLAASIESMGGIARGVEAPPENDFPTWLDEYAKSASLSLSDGAKKKITSASGKDPDSAVTIINVMGAEIENLSEDDIRTWLDSEEDASGQDIRMLMEKRDVSGLARLRRTFPPNSQGYRTFLVKLRHNLTDIAIASASNGDAAPLFSYKAAQYGNGNSAYYVMRETAGSSHTLYYLALYREINDQIEALAKGGHEDLPKLLAAVASPHIACG